MRDSDGKPTCGRTILDELVDVIDVAAELTTSLANDPVLYRLIEAFRLMPFEDRETVVGAVEREVSARRLSRATEDATGQSMHPNPRARLYVRAHENTAPRRHLERDELMISMLRGMRVTAGLLVPEVHAAWLDGTREALEHLDPEMRATVAQLARELMTLAEAPGPVAPESRAVRAS